MTKRAVIGLGYGDEGKGVITEYLCASNPETTLVTRFSGGQQAAHTVYKGDLQHVFSHFGSGTLSGCPTYWSKQCTMNPWLLLVEFKKLIKIGVNPQIHIHPGSRVTTPYDMQHGQEQDKTNGTTGHGIYRTIQRNKQIPFMAESLFYMSPEDMNKRLNWIAEYYSLNTRTDYWIEAVYDLRNMLDKSIYINMSPPNYEHTIFEGSQGLMLDEKIGIMPHCTPSDVTPASITKYGLDEIILVTRAYQSRHGNGPMTNGDLPVALKNNENETCVFNRFQGEFRTTTLDLDQLIHAKTVGIDKVVPKDVEISLAVTCMDQLDLYKVTRYGKEYIFSTPETFVEFLGEYLDVNGKLYLNDSPYSNLKSWNVKQLQWSGD